MLNNIAFFLVGVLTTAFLIVIIKQYNKRSSIVRETMTQSLVFLELKSFMPDLIKILLNKATQTQDYESTRGFKYIEMADNRAYWLERNRIYYADIAEDGAFDLDNGKPAVMKNLSESEITKTLFIYNSLKNER